MYNITFYTLHIIHIPILHGLRFEMYILDKFLMHASDFAAMSVVCTFRNPRGYAVTMSTLSL